jgi:hypothetical protein
MSQEKFYRLTFYESGYIEPKEFERREYREFSDGSHSGGCGLLLSGLFLTSEQLAEVNLLLSVNPTEKE